ncbi:MAG: hypothetical protein DYG93_12090 [Leptolyngbya sp. PLA2]|nr:hypothetical protein [Leptolyngbya sp.]MCE7972384.1 hypothetical protein [Leptolyngbya sp. PL-A2]
MVYFGKVKGGRIELDPPGRLPEGARVRVEPVGEQGSGNGQHPDPADNLASEAVDVGITDMSDEHDHYAAEGDDPVYHLGDDAADAPSLSADLAARHDHFLCCT